MVMRVHDGMAATATKTKAFRTIDVTSRRLSRELRFVQQNRRQEGGREHFYRMIVG